MVQSIYTFYFERNNKYYLYNSLSGLFCEVSLDTYSSLYNRDYTRISEETIAFLIENKVLINEKDKYVFLL